MRNCYAWIIFTYVNNGKQTTPQGTSVQYLFYRNTTKKFLFFSSRPFSTIWCSIFSSRKNRKATDFLLCCRKPFSYRWLERIWRIHKPIFWLGKRMFHDYNLYARLHKPALTEFGLWRIHIGRILLPFLTPNASL